MKVLVTGGAGFIGSHTVEKLLQRGDEPVILDNFNDAYDPSLKRAVAAATGARVLTADLTDRDALRDAFDAAAPEAILHFAARAGVRASIEQPRLYLDTNVQGTLNLLDEAAARHIHRFVFASSSSVYGNNPVVPFHESHALHAIASPYAVTKLAAENLGRIYADLHGLSFTALRFFTVYGPRQRPDLAISKFTRLIAAGRPIELYGDGTTSRDYTYVDDIVAGVLSALDRALPGFNVFNIGGTHPVSLAELVTLLERTIGRPALIHRLPPQPGDVERTYADTSAARARLGYTPAVSIEEGLARYWRWLQSQPSS